MADTKAAKLAAARRKLKDHQEKKSVQTLSSSFITAEKNPIQNFESQSEVIVSQGASLDKQDCNEHESAKPKISMGESLTPSYMKDTMEPDVEHTGASTAMQQGKEQLAVLEDREQRELQHHEKHLANATEILVMDKRKLELKVHSLEDSLRHLESAHAETLVDLNIAKQNSSKLDTELRDVKAYIKSLRQELESKTEEVDRYKIKESKVTESTSELEEKLDMAMTALTAKKTENSSLQNQLTLLQRELDITQLHLQQLTNGGPVSDNDATLDPKSILEQNNSLHNKVSRLEQELKLSQNEREQLISHYQQYIQQLNDQLETTMARNQQYALENESLSNREISLVDQISEMEKRIQALQQHISSFKTQEQSTDHSLSALDSARLKHQLEESQARVHLLEEEYRKAEKQLSESEHKIIELTESIQTLQTEQPDITKLSAAIESDKVAAQRATAQNAKLKEELQGLQDAFVAMSNDKLELTEKLQAEKFLNRELTIKLSESEETLKDIQNKLMAKDEEMIRLQSSCSKLEKELLQNTQEIDRLRHYEVTQSTDEVLKRELDHANHIIANLKQEITTSVDASAHTSEHCNNYSQNIKEDATKMQCNNEEDKKTIAFTPNNYENISTDTNLNVIPTEEAMIKLQQRFLKTMREVAELSDEKQNLEHIVLQLQGETETICEYIALYQQQRGILKQREEERAAQVKYMSVERERMQAQLEELQRMVTGGAGDAAPTLGQQKEQILNLLSDIKQSHLIDPNKQCTGLENFNPCPWCSGKLINV